MKNYLLLFALISAQSAYSMKSIRNWWNQDTLEGEIANAQQDEAATEAFITGIYTPFGHSVFKAITWWAPTSGKAIKKHLGTNTLYTAYKVEKYTKECLGESFTKEWGAQYVEDMLEARMLGQSDFFDIQKKSQDEMEKLRACVNSKMEHLATLRKQMGKRPYNLNDILQNR